LASPILGAADVELLETLKELGQVVDGRIPAGTSKIVCRIYLDPALLPLTTD
jgi:hypothetical protein